MALVENLLSVMLPEVAIHFFGDGYKSRGVFIIPYDGYPIHGDVNPSIESLSGSPPGCLRNWLKWTCFNMT